MPPLRTKRPQPVRDARLEHVEHRRDDQLVGVERARRLDHVDRDAELPEGPVVVDGRVVVLLVERPPAGPVGALPRPLGRGEGPAHLPVKEHRDLGSDAGADDRVELLQQRPVSGDVLEDAALLAALVVDDRAVELLEASAALAPLEVHRRVGAVADREQHLLLVLSGLLERGRGVPVRARGRRFHQDERPPALHCAVDVVREAGVDRDLPGVVVVEEEVGVQCHAVADVGEAPVVEPVESAHHVRRDGLVGRQAAQRRDLVLHEVDGLVRREAQPVQPQAVERRLARLDLLPGREALAPEAGPIGLVEGIEAAVACAQPVAEARQAEVAEALAVVLVGDVPAREGGVSGVALGQARVDLLHLAAVDG